MGDSVARYRVLVLGFGGFVLLQGASAAWLFVKKLGLTPTEVATFYRGAPGGVPRSAQGLLEVVLPHLLAVPITLFVLLHMVAWARQRGSLAYRRLTGLTFALALLGVAAGLLTRYAWPQVATIKLAAFWGSEALLAYWLVALAAAWWPGRPPESNQAPSGPGPSGTPAPREA